MDNAYRILLIEHDADVRELVERALAGAGYVVSTPADEAPDVSSPPDLVVLDLGVPGGLDLDVLRTWRERGTAVVMLAGWTDTDDRVRALEAGADDFVAKPFSSRELVARVQSVLRRSDPAKRTRLDFGALLIDLVAREVRVRDKPVDLTARQFDLLVLLATNAGRVFGREELLGLVWGSSSQWQSSATVTEHIHRIRRQIEDDPARPRILRTVRGAGYR
nr:response regulator transcription factor [Actinomycetota bacterium]